MKSNLKINKNIVFIGMPGCGKTSIGREVAKKLSLSFYDIDEYIEKKTGKLIKEIFLDGEAYFRKLESEAIKEISENCPSVISTGGGSVKVPENMKALQKHSIIIFINRPIEKIIENIDISTRPLLADDINRLYKLYEERYNLYKSYCNIEVLNDIDLESVIDKIVELIED